MVDPAVQKKLQDINDSPEEHFRREVDAFVERFDFGYNKFAPMFSEKNEIIKTIAHHFTISSKLEEIQQFLKGLSTFGVLDLIRKYPRQSRSLFLFENYLTAEAVKSCLVTEHQQEDNQDEEDIVFNLKNFIDEVGLCRVKSVSAFTFENVEDGVIDESQKGTVKITLEDVLKFLTGSRFISSSLKIKIRFDHVAIGRVRVSTCQNEIKFPVHQRYTGDDFSQNFTEDILNSPGFGNV